MRKEEANTEDGKFTIEVRSVMEEHLAEALQHIAEGRTSGPYNTASEAMAVLELRSQPSAATSE